MYYSSPEQVIAYTGIQPSDLFLNTEEELKDLIEQWLVEATDYIHYYQKINYFEEFEAGKIKSIPKAVNNIAMRIVANMIALAKIRRDTSVIRVNDYYTKMVEDDVLTEKIKADLKILPNNRNKIRFC